MVFLDMVKEIWLGVSTGNNALVRWQAKIRCLRQHLRNWTKNVSGAYKKEKKELLDKIDDLDKKAEYTMLSYDELNLKLGLNKRLTEHLREEGLK